MPLLLLLSRFSRVWLCVTPQMAAHQAPPSLGFSRQEHWSGLPFPSPMHESKKWKWSCSVVSNSSWPHGLQPTQLLHPWDFPGKSTGSGVPWPSPRGASSRNQTIKSFRKTSEAYSVWGISLIWDLMTLIKYISIKVTDGGKYSLCLSEYIAHQRLIIQASSHGWW